MDRNFGEGSDPTLRALHFLVVQIRNVFNLYQKLTTLVVM